ncbi:hypothetical protein VHUM_00495 [Vanrija humicola]|uniref:D-arabinono-1,4-lactone oxidase n=1 Tax=Vanrija humicola TaxID=5417 RepID=A0A7D8V4N0_VANHU|nr:hypothetical protein VHUM_00495 [Vanrija humicola]
MGLDQDLTAVATADLQRALEPISVPTASPLAFFTNWARTFQCRPARVFAPTTALQCRQIIELARREKATVHPVGVGHSPSDLACTNGWLVRMEGVKGLISLSHTANTAVFRAGTTLHEVHAALLAAEPPLALRNVGSISDQTIGGLISTATHGTGVAYQVVSGDVRSLDLVLPTAGAPVVHVSPTQDPELFKASQCGLGATGLILTVEIAVEPAYRLEEHKQSYDNLDEVFENINDIKGTAQHVRAWWYPAARGIIVARANRTYVEPQPKPSLLGHFLGFHVTQFLLFVSRYWRNFTPYVGRWAYFLARGSHTAIDHSHKIFNFDCLFPQYTSEWALDAAQARAALDEIKVWLDAEAADPNGQRVHFPIEIRWSAADDIWLSPSQGRETVWIGLVTFRPYGLAVPYRVFQNRFAQICAAHGGRPHWAKEHDLTPKGVEALYPKFEDFKRVVARVDPDGVLRSEYTRRHFDGEDIDARFFKERRG